MGKQKGTRREVPRRGINSDDPAFDLYELGQLATAEIRQWEIAAFYRLEKAKDALALAFKRRIEAGAQIEAGQYYLEPEDDTVYELERAGEGRKPVGVEPTRDTKYRTTGLKPAPSTGQDWLPARL
jgi:hypothetical protein